MFQFKQFTIHQEQTAMKVGTDGVLLGAWAEPERASFILDIGTGTGLLALMAAQRNPQARIDAVEIEPEAAKQARENVTASPWNERIEVHPLSVFDFTPKHLYDCILCNPPFFINSTKNPDKGRSLARHTDTLSPIALAKTVSDLLAPQGYFYLVLPPTEANVFIEHAHCQQLHIARITHVLPNPDKVPKRFLMKFGRTEMVPETDELVVELSRHEYSPEYIRLTKDFYLKF